MIILKNVCKYFGKDETLVKAVDGVDLEIESGEFLCITGESGGGKTTLLNLIGGIDTPTGGNVIIDGVDISSMRDDELSRFRNKYIGYVFQDFLLDYNLSAKTNIELPMLIGNVDRKRRSETVDMLTERLGLTKTNLNKSVKLFSGGEKQRIAIARALANDPKVILADEPTGNLDTKTGYEIMTLLKEINLSGVTVIMVTHNESHIKYASRHVKIMDGRVISEEKVCD